MSRRTVFVSYSRKDSTQVAKAVELLEAGGADVFRDLDDIQYGDRWEDVIRTKLAEAERVLVFWSTNAQLSEWVEREWTVAISMQKRVVPILLDQTPLPQELGQFHALTNFILPNTATQVQKPTVLSQTKSRLYWLWGGLVGLALLVIAISISTLNLQKAEMPPEIVAMQQSTDSELNLPDNLGQGKDLEDLVTDSTTEPSTADSGNQSSPIAPITQLPPPSLAPEPAFKDESRNYVLSLSAFLAFFAIISYLVWRHRQQHKKLQAGEKLVQEIFQE
ncbi:toll/interleukin-1 receptor domain-containing protein [uncultured Thiothrix sp.]|mgnify:CR=1 FL=1|uniref:toll/interleukin-1 receptor domain-containing protein n=1 Tax=uncultured Thiothrix sp. TaxID=223185 RepID=UPI0026361962|nr:toll/interleukin-1 receptor domain-containing protein [uncultured Thiothrix sp.]HMT91929.1 toll/interleukin-1 receptor domain-containing protein [Thiolinea sp.]